jgi:hypothetical protein
MNMSQCKGAVTLLNVKDLKVKMAGSLVNLRGRLHTSRAKGMICLITGLWIRIDLMRIRIQHFFSIRIQFRIRIQAKTELSKTISLSNFFEIKI